MENFILFQFSLSSIASSMAWRITFTQPLLRRKERRHFAPRPRPRTPRRPRRPRRRPRPFDIAAHLAVRRRATAPVLVMRKPLHLILPPFRQSRSRRSSRAAQAQARHLGCRMNSSPVSQVIRKSPPPSCLRTRLPDPTDGALRLADKTRLNWLFRR